MNPTSRNVKGFFSVAIIQGRSQLINNLNSLGYPTAMNISNQDLVDKLFTIYQSKGADEINKIIAGIGIDKSKITQAQLNAIRSSLTGEDTSASKTFLETLQELWAGVKDTIGGVKETTSTPIINPMAAIAVTIVGIIVVLVIAFRK